MIDGWTNRRRRTILNFLVNSKGIVFLSQLMLLTYASHLKKISG